uniref:Uncharacterized protein n=1 Tax=Arundo donax TaxID=35708 RepID=A0A0A9EPY5_ARUDO
MGTRWTELGEMQTL